MIAAQRTRPLRLPLVAVLAVVTLAELVLNRVVARMLRLEPFALRTPLVRALDGIGYFFFELVSVLAVLMLAAALVRMALYGSLYRPGARVSFPLVGLVCVALAGLGVVVRLPPALLFHLHLSFLFLALLVVLTTVSAPTDFGVKLGTVLFVAALALRLYPTMSRRFSSTPGFVDATTFELAGAGLLIAVTLGSLCLTPRRGRTRAAWVFTWVVVCGAALLMRRDWDTAARIAAFGFQVDLPSSLPGQALLLVALGFYSNTLARLLSEPGLPRLRGWGLLLLGLGGLQLDLPYQVSLASLGLLCLAESAVRPDGRVLTREAFEQLVRRAAAALGAPQVTLTGRDGFESVQLHAPAAAERPVAVRLARRAGAVQALEITVGEALERDPPFTLERRGQPRLGPRADGPLVETGDPEFDSRFRQHDRRDIGAPLLDDLTRARMALLLGGWLGLWPQRGLCYRAAELPHGDEGLSSLLTLLAELARRTA